MIQVQRPGRSCMNSAQNSLTNATTGQFFVSLHTADISPVLVGSLSRSSPPFDPFTAPTLHELRHALWLIICGDQDWLDKAVGIEFYHLLIFLSTDTFSLVLGFPSNFSPLDARGVTILPLTTTPN